MFFSSYFFAEEDNDNYMCCCLNSNNMCNIWWSVWMTPEVSYISPGCPMLSWLCLFC